MERRIRVEIVGRDSFWRHAVKIEWEHQFPDRPLAADANGFYLIPADWLPDLERVAEQCFSKVLIAPEDPSRRFWFRRLIPRGDRR